MSQLLAVVFLIATALSCAASYYLLKWAAE